MPGIFCAHREVSAHMPENMLLFFVEALALWVDKEFGRQ